MAESVDCRRVFEGSATESDVLELEKQVREFLSGVVDHKGPPFYKHLKKGVFNLSILPGDRVIDDFDSYVAFQEAWICNKDAIWSYQVEKVLLYDKQSGFVVILATYEDVDQQGVKFRKRLRIKDNFLKIDDIWYLAENQNTLISEEKPIDSFRET